MEMHHLLSQLSASGFTITAGGCNTIELHGPITCLTADLREAIAQHKPTLLAMLPAGGGGDPLEIAERWAIRTEADAPADANAIWRAALASLVGDPLFPPELLADLRNVEVRWAGCDTTTTPSPDGWLADERERQAILLAGGTAVANLGRDHRLIAWATGEGLAKRIDRRTPFGNPSRIGTDGNREAVCERFERERLPALAHRLPELRGKLLLCHCFPERCHGDSLAKAAGSTTTPPCGYHLESGMAAGWPPTATPDPSL